MTPKAAIISAAAIVGALATIIGAYHGATLWADTRFISRAEASDYHARASVAQNLQYHEAMVKIAELELAALEAEIEAEGDDPTAAQQRAVDRALDKIEFHESEMQAARKRLAEEE